MQAISVLSLLLSFHCISTAYISFGTGSGSTSVKRSSSGATTIQLSRRGSLADEGTGLLNQDALDAHLRYVLRKQIVGAMNYYMNTGNVLATFNMTPYQLEDAYNSGSLPLIQSEDDAASAPVETSKVLSAVEAVDAVNSTLGRSRVAIRGGTIEMNNLGAKDLIWAAPVQIGTPPKTFMVSVDTGSADLFLASDKCPTAQCVGKNLYTPSQSTTAASINKAYTISFGDGSSVKADVMSDSVMMGGVMVPRIAVGAVTQLSPEFQSSTGDTSDGLMGFGFPSLSQSKSDPFFTALTKQDPQLGVIGTRFVRKSTSGSELTIGGVNPAAFRGPFTTLNVMAMMGQPAGFWDVTFDGVVVNGQRITLSSPIATIDTGTSIIGVPQQDARAFYAAIPGATTSGGGQYTFPCTSLPAVSMGFGGRLFNINPSDMTIGKDASGNCVGGIVGMNKKGVWLVGQVFLKNVYTAYDQRNYTVSFADLA